MLKGSSKCKRSKRKEALLLFLTVLKIFLFLFFQPIGLYSGKYEWAARPGTGDCSLNILAIDIKFDDGLWECQVTASSFESQDALASKPARLVVRGIRSIIFNSRHKNDKMHRTGKYFRNSFSRRRSRQAPSPFHYSSKNTGRSYNMASHACFIDFKICVLFISILLEKGFHHFMK